ncbi:MAG: hypothetical protein GY861_22375 [bacterium]|nr:hypothetical protein [bacterium]
MEEKDYQSLDAFINASEEVRHTLQRYGKYRNNQSRLGELIARVIGTPGHVVINNVYIRYYTWNGIKYYSKLAAINVPRESEEKPKELRPVLAHIRSVNDLGISMYYEVVYYDVGKDKWCSYAGSKTFNDGEYVMKWKYAAECF